MSGPRPRSGRPSQFVYRINDITYQSLDEAAAAESVSKMTISRWCRGGKEGCSRQEVSHIFEETLENVKSDVSGYREKASTEPLDLWLYVLDHPDDFDMKTRMQAAYYAAPYRHPKADKNKSKKELKADKAREAGAGRFAPGRPPHLKMVSGINQKKRRINQRITGNQWNKSKNRFIKSNNRRKNQSVPSILIVKRLLFENYRDRLGDRAVFKTGLSPLIIFLFVFSLPF